MRSLGRVRAALPMTPRRPLYGCQRCEIDVRGTYSPEHRASARKSEAQRHSGTTEALGRVKIDAPLSAAGRDLSDGSSVVSEHALTVSDCGNGRSEGAVDG